MTTPVLFLDDASRHIGALRKESAQQIAMKLLATLKRLRKINNRIALNTARPIAQYQIADNWTLQAVLGGDDYKEEWAFVRGLSDRSPLSAGLTDGMRQEIDDMECRTRSGRVPSSALAWAMLLDSATVSFDAHSDWSLAWVDTSYGTLDDAGNLTQASSRVRNASQPTHADEHADWLKALGLLAVPTTAAQVWRQKDTRFPGLRFLPRTENDLMELDGSGAPFRHAVAALDSLAKVVAAWPDDSEWPAFSTHTTSEGEQRKKLCWVRDDETGQRELFDWHTRFTGGWDGRIHFRVDTENRLIVVAYVGHKLTREISS